MAMQAYFFDDVLHVSMPAREEERGADEATEPQPASTGIFSLRPQWLSPQTALKHAPKQGTASPDSSTSSLSSMSDVSFDDDADDWVHVSEIGLSDAGAGADC